MAIYLVQPEVWEILTKRTTFTVLKFLTSTPNLPSRASHSTCGV